MYSWLFSRVDPGFLKEGDSQAEMTDVQTQKSAEELRT